MRLRNFTPDAVCVVLDGRNAVTLPSEGQIRLGTQRVPRSPIAGVPVNHVVRGGLVGAPAVVGPDDYFIVSDAVREYVSGARAQYPDWWRYLSPDTSPESVLRDSAGRIVAVGGLVSSL